MRLRSAVFKDWKFLLDLRSDPVAMLNSFNQSEISEDSHKKWLQSSLASTNREIFIMEDLNNTPVGTIRCDTNKEGQQTLSWNISPNHRGQGLGNLMLSLFFKNKKGTFIAEIKKENISSIKMANRNGFTNTHGDVYKKYL